MKARNVPFTAIYTGLQPSRVSKHTNLHPDTKNTAAQVSNLVTCFRKYAVIIYVNYLIT